MEGLKTIRLLVVGGSGFIGSHVAKKGIDCGWRVDSFGLRMPAVGRTVSGVNYLIGNLTNQNDLHQLSNINYDYVVNLGGYVDHALFFSGGEQQISDHFIGLINLIRMLKREKIKRFIQVGSGDEYGSNSSPQQEGLREQSISPYSLAKACSTHFLQMLYRTENYPAVIARIFLAYGPGQDGNRFLPQIIQGCIEGREFPVSKGEQLRDFCYIEDVVDAIYKIFACERANGEIFNIGAGQSICIKEVITKVVALVGKGCPRYGEISYRVGENMASYPCVEKIKKIVGWRPKIELDEGLLRTIEWIKGAKK